MKLRHLIIIGFCIVLSSCGASNSQKDGLAPKYISGKIFELTIGDSPVGELGKNLPAIGNKIIQEYSHNRISYIQSDQYQGLGFIGEYKYQRNNDKAETTLKLVSSSTVYTLHYKFKDKTSGTWQGIFNNGKSTLSGTFTSKWAPNLNAKNFKKTVYIAEQSIHSDITNITYQYNVYLPNGYSASKKKYPVIYVTDAQWGSDERFANIVQSKQKDIIVVGITQGPEGQRNTDFLWPSSRHYLDFFAQEFLPLVESLYRIDTDNRTLYGHSYGGILIRHALINEVDTPLFKNFISSDGPFRVKDTNYRKLETDVYKKNSLNNRKLFLTGGMLANGSSVSRFSDTIQSYDLAGFTVYHQSFELGHNHVALPGIRSAMDTLFP
jgi:predicted alpha/beta superfamily hydrolase